MNEFSLFLAARPSFIEGFSRTLDIGGTLCEYNTSLTKDQADYIALRADWRAVARDLGIAFKEEVATLEKASSEK